MKRCAAVGGEWAREGQEQAESGMSLPAQLPRRDRWESLDGPRLEEEADPVSSRESGRDCGAAQSVARVEAGNWGKPEAGMAGVLGVQGSATRLGSSASLRPPLIPRGRGTYSKPVLKTSSPVFKTLM